METHEQRERNVRGRDLIWTLWRGSDDFGIGQACSQWSNICFSRSENDIYPESIRSQALAFCCPMFSVPRVHTCLCPSFLKRNYGMHSFPVQKPSLMPQHPLIRCQCFTLWVKSHNTQSPSPNLPTLLSSPHLSSALVNLPTAGASCRCLAKGNKIIC